MVILCMDRDARKLSDGALHELRRQVIRLHKAGHKMMRIVELTGLTWLSVRRAIDRYEAEGAAGLKPKTRGRSPGDGRSLSAEQEGQIRRLICEKRPEQLKMDFALWTRGAVMELIARECGISLKIRAVGNYLKRWGFTPRKPIRRAYEQSPAAVRA